LSVEEPAPVEEFPQEIVALPVEESAPVEEIAPLPDPAKLASAKLAERTQAAPGKLPRTVVPELDDDAVAFLPAAWPPATHAARPKPEEQGHPQETGVAEAEPLTREELAALPAAWPPATHAARPKPEEQDHPQEDASKPEPLTREEIAALPPVWPSEKREARGKEEVAAPVESGSPRLTREEIAALPPEWPPEKRARPKRDTPERTEEAAVVSRRLTREEIAALPSVWPPDKRARASAAAERRAVSSPIRPKKADEPAPEPIVVSKGSCWPGC